MKVFLKYISKNMMEKKGRLFLLIFSIAMSTALLVASAGIVDIIFDSFTKPYEMANGADMGIVSAQDDPFISPNDFNSDKLENITCELNSMGVMNEADKLRYVSLHGRESFSGKMKEGNASFLGTYRKAAAQTTAPDCIISERIATELKLSAGSTLKLYISGEPIEFRIKAIAVNDGLFYADTTSQFNLIIPYEYLNSMMQADGKYNYISADLKKGDLKDYLNEFNETYPELNAYSLQGELVVDSSITALLYAMLAIVVVVSAIIIKGVFKLIMTERLTVLGTFMSQGATKRKIEGIVLLESAMYAVFGGAAGCTLGEVLLFFIGRMVSPLAEYGIYTPFRINPIHIVAGFLFALILSVISAYAPVRSIRKYEVKDVILNRAEAKPKSRHFKVIAGGLMLIFSVGIALTNNGSESAASLIATVTAFAGLILVTPALVKFLAGLLCRLFKANTTVYLTMNNIRTSKLLRSNIVLIVVSLSAVLLISSFGVSMTELVTGAYDSMSYDYNIGNIQPGIGEESTTDLITDKLRNISGIDRDSIVTVGNAEGKLDGEFIVLTATDILPYGRYLDGYTPLISAEGNDYEEFAKFTDNAVFITSKISKTINKGKGDTVTLEVNSRKESFRVAGVYDGKVYNNGLSIIIDKSCAKRVFNMKDASNIAFSLDGSRSAEDVEQDFRSYISSLGATYSTKDEDCRTNNEQNAMIVNIMSVFSYLALIIASIGVFNNITISFHQRKKEFAVMSSTGMTKKQRRNMILLESMFSVLISVIITTPFMLLLTDLFTGCTYFLGIPMVTRLSWATLPKFSLAVAAIVFVASLSTMGKSRKLSIVQELKYE